LVATAGMRYFGVIVMIWKIINIAGGGMNHVKKLRLAFLGLLLALGLQGCEGCFQPGETFYYDDGVKVGDFFGVVNDSLVVLTTARNSRTVHEQPLAAPQTDYECWDQKLHVVNIKTKGPIVWSTSIDECIFWASQIDDSLFVLKTSVSDFGLGRMYFVEIGGEQQSFDSKEVKIDVENCDTTVINAGLIFFKPWKNNNYITYRNYGDSLGNNCEYVEFDIAAKEMTYKRFSENDRWMAACQDLKYQDGAVHCLKEAEYLETDSIEIYFYRDTMLIDSMRQYIKDDEQCKLVFNSDAWVGSSFFRANFDCPIDGSIVANRESRFYRVDDEVNYLFKLSESACAVWDDSGEVCYYPEDFE
jgi:hypothetical protein